MPASRQTVERERIPPVQLLGLIGAVPLEELE
jgi:hypothetical protein